MQKGQIFLAAGEDSKTVEILVEYGWLEKDTIEGVGEVYTLTKEGFRWLQEEYWKGHA